MKKGMVSIAMTLILMGCANTSNNQNSVEMETENRQMENTIFPKGSPAASDYFTGTAWVNVLLQKPGYSVGDVIFEPGCRNHWHSHPVGQVLLVTDGEGWYQEKGKPAQRIRKGDVVDIPADVIHWHGATNDSRLVHLAITDNGPEGNVVWLEPVTDEEYAHL